jgi:hypothetical protein
MVVSASCAAPDLPGHVTSTNDWVRRVNLKINLEALEPFRERSETILNKPSCAARNQVYDYGDSGFNGSCVNVRGETFGLASMLRLPFEDVEDFLSLRRFVPESRES